MGGAVNYTLLCGVGTYVYTGNAATLTVGRRLALAAGAYTYAGQPATLTVQRRLLLDAGAYSYIGQDASLQVGRNFALDTGAYIYTGLDAALNYAPGVAQDIPEGGAGYPVWRKKEPRSPSNSLDLLWDLVLSEHYESLINSGAPTKVKKQAAAVVKPFASKPAKLPKASQVDWAALEMDVARVEKLLKILEEQGILRAIDDDDETIFLMVH